MGNKPKEERNIYNLILAAKILNTFFELRDSKDEDVTVSKDDIIQWLQSIHVRDTLLMLAMNYTDQDQRDLSHFIYKLIGTENPDVGHYSNTEQANVSATAAALIWYTLADDDKNEIGIELSKDLVNLTLQLNPAHSLGNLFNRCLTFNVPYRVFKDSMEALTLKELIV